MGAYDMQIGPSLSDLMNQRAMQQAQIFNAGQDAQMRNLQLQQGQQEFEQKNQLRDLMPKIMNGDDPQATLKALLSSGNPQAIALAGQIAPVMAAMQKDTKTSWQDGGDKLFQLDAYGNPTGKTMLKGAPPKEKTNWSEPFNMGGATVQRNLDTGEIRQAVARAPVTNINNQPAPTMTEVIDPNNPKQLIRIDARQYRGGSLGAPGVLGISGKEPGAAKIADQVDAGRGTLETLGLSLKDYYGQLNTNGGITSTKNRAGTNLGAGIASSGIGQSVGRMLGTADQSLRNQIIQQRPLLLQAIKQATGMSAKQMDSNAEMKMYLAAATDPTLDLEANLSALDMLSKLYGGGNQNTPAKPPALPKQPTKPGVVDFGSLK